MNENFDHQHQDLELKMQLNTVTYLEFMDFEYLRNSCIKFSYTILLSLGTAPTNVGIE
jgi:hypothetical protein